MRDELFGLNHCAVLFLSRAATNLCCTIHRIICIVKGFIIHFLRMYATYICSYAIMSLLDLRILNNNDVISAFTKQRNVCPSTY